MVEEGSMMGGIVVEVRDEVGMVVSVDCEEEVSELGREEDARGIVTEGTSVERGCCVVGDG